LHLFFTSNSVVFVDGERKNISCPRAQSTLTTPLPLKVTMAYYPFRSTLRLNHKNYLIFCKNFQALYEQNTIAAYR